ncbi:MAG: DUF1801 domain-containing protein [Patescibacteria group bacterium]
MDIGVQTYNAAQTIDNQAICNDLYQVINANLTGSENKVWHGAPVWFIDGNPIVGYSVQKPGVRLMFWSGSDFDETKLRPGTGKFKDASIFYTSRDQINLEDIKRWLEISVNIQWGYKNIVKRKGVLLRLK